MRLFISQKQNGFTSYNNRDSTDLIFCRRVAGFKVFLSFEKYCNRRCITGLTLIETLVVLAVIGILSSVLLITLGPARHKAKDSRIIQEVNQVRSFAETLYDGDYDALESLPAVSITNETLKMLAEDITLQGGELVIIKSPQPATTYLVYSKLNETVTEGVIEQIKYYCVDSSGWAGFTTTEPINTTKCPLE